MLFCSIANYKREAVEAFSILSSWLEQQALPPLFTNKSSHTRDPLGDLLHLRVNVACCLHGLTACILDKSRSTARLTPAYLLHSYICCSLPAIHSYCFYPFHNRALFRCCCPPSLGYGVAKGAGAQHQARAQLSSGSSHAGRHL